jgi:ATP-binding cassette subfamily F protein 3
MGEVPPLAGTLRRGASLRVGYFAQAHTELNVENTVLGEFLAQHDTPTSEARSYLARFLFLGDDVFKPVAALSGGERGRLALALLMRRPANFLLLDEPTNHLDIPSQELLQSELAGFAGTILLVSHDRYLISHLVTQVWALVGDRLRVFKNGYGEYLAAQERGEAVPGAPWTAGQERKRRKRGRRRLKAAERRPSRDALAARRAQQAAHLEQTISELEAQLAALTARLEAATVAQQFDKVHQLGLEYRQAEAELDRHVREWVKAADVQGEV